MKSLKVLSYPEFNERAESVDLYFKVKRGQLISNNLETDIIHKNKTARHIKEELESYFDSIADEIQMGLVVEMELDDGTRKTVNFIEDIEEELTDIIYQ